MIPARQYPTDTSGYPPYQIFTSTAVASSMQVLFSYIDARSDAEREADEFLRQCAAQAELRAVTQALQRAPDPPPKPPRVRAPRPPVAWPAQMQRFRCSTRSRGAGRPSK